jgi:hypothetical protein
MMARQTPPPSPDNVRTWSGILDSGYITSLDPGNTSNTVDNDDNNNDDNEGKPKHLMLKSLLERVGTRQLKNKHNRSANLTLP